MMAVIEAAGRTGGTTESERAALLLSTVAYSERYRLEGDRWITKVDAAWVPAFHDTEQVRFYKLEGERLVVTSPWAPDPRLPQQPEARAVLVWQRVE